MTSYAKPIHSDNTVQHYFSPQLPIPTISKKRSNGLISQLLTIRKYMTSPLETFSASQFEKPVTIQTLLGVQSTYLNDPEFIRYCFVENASNYNHSPIRQSLLRPALRDGLLTTEGEHWRQSRKALAPVFVPKNVNNFAKTMLDCSNDFLDQLRGKTDPVKLSDAMSRLTFLILSETLFSGEINEDSEEMLNVVDYFMANLARPHLFDLLQAPEWIPRPSKIRGRSPIQSIRDLVIKAISKRKHRIAAGEEVPRDFLTLLLEAEYDGAHLTRDEIVDNILTFIGAGHETTARGVTWTIYLLSQSPEFLSKVRNEIDNLDMASEPPENWGSILPWTTAAFEEAMRMYPPAPVFTRAAINADKYKGYLIPARSNIVLAAWLLHHHKTLWDHPEHFNPERFYGENRKKIDRFAYLPFGVGARVCIGARFAMQEAVIMLSVLLRTFNFTYAEDQAPVPELRITLQPGNGMPMKITERT